MEKTASKIFYEISIKPSDRAVELALKHGLLPYMVERYLRMLGDEGTIKLLNSFQKPVRPVVRANTNLVDPEKLEKSLSGKGFVLETISWYEGAFRILQAPGKPSLGATVEYLKGYYYLHRDSSSLVPVILLTHEYAGDVLDACAAPGGKATFLAERIRDHGTVYANDLVLRRLKSLIGHVARMKFENVSIMWSDARKLPVKLTRSFERILLDAPCSGEGRISIDPGRRNRTSLYELSLLVKREIELLDSLINLLENEGIIVYSTCSLAPEENEYVISKVIEARGDIEIIPPPVKLFDYSPGITRFGDMEFPRELERCVRLWPHVHGTFGFTTCMLRRTRR